MADHGHVMRHEQTGWVGWIALASYFMILAGFFQSIFGLAALFQDDIIISGSSRVWLLSLTNWGWAHLLLGILLLVVGFGLMRAGAVSRTIAVLLVGFSAIANFLFIPVYPIWSIILLVVNSLVIYAIIAHGSELAEMEE